MRDVFLLLLSLAAGCVDAIAFVHTGAFPANMTGNSVVLGLALARANVSGVTLSGMVLVGFFLGAAGGAMLTTGASRTHLQRINLSLVIAGILLLAAAGMVEITGTTYLSWLTVTAAVAMGLQSVAVQRLGIAGVATVFVTGTFTTAIMRLIDGQKASQSPPPPSPLLPALSWSFYFLGAILGGLESVWQTPIPIVLPGLLLITVGLAARRFA